MPYRHAHYYLLLLYPISALAFWPGYLSDMAGAPYAFHIHGLTAAAWIALLAFQSWSIHSRRNAAHRALGYASFALFPLFLAGGLLVIQTMAQKFAARADPFYAIYGARLGLYDTVSSVALPWFFYMGIGCRRKVHLHARWLLSTLFFLVGPILSRILPVLPPLAIEGPEDFYRFSYAVHISNAAAIAMAAALYLKAPRHGRPFLVGGALVAAQSLLFETIGRTAPWEDAFSAIASVPTALLVSLGLAAGLLAGWAGWTAGAAPRRKAPLPAE